MQNITRLIVFCLALVLCAPALHAAQSAAQADASAEPSPLAEYVINMATVYPLDHHLVQNVLRPWAENIMEQSGGRLFIRMFEPGAIADAGRLGRAVRLGQAGMALSLLSAEAEDFPLSLLAAQGPGSIFLKELSGAYWRMFTELPELGAEFTGIKLLAVFASDPYQLCMAGRLPFNTESLAGKRFLVDSPLTAMKMESFGAPSTIIQQPDLKMFIEDKIADGVVLNISALSRLGLMDYIGGISLGDLENGVFWLGMHQGAWDMLPQDLRNVLAKSTGLAFSQFLGERASQNYRAQLEKLERQGVKMHYFSAEERARFNRNTQNVAQDAWQSIAREKGINIRALQDKIAKIMADAKVR